MSILVPVSKPGHRNCDSSKHAQLPAGNGYIFNQMDQGYSVGFFMCKWRIEAMTGQQIHVTFISLKQQIREESTRPLG